MHFIIQINLISFSSLHKYFLNRLTFYDDNELKVQLWDHDGSYGEIIYQPFKVLAWNENYTLKIGPMKKSREWDNLFSNPVHDSMSNHDKVPFSTKDYDNDKNKDTNIAKKLKTGGWIKKMGNMEANLFGENLGSIKTKKSWIGVNWESFRGSKYSLKKAIMSIRPKNHVGYGR